MLFNHARAPVEFPEDIANSALAFRGYNITNLGRSGELLGHPRYGPIVRQHLRAASRVCSEVIGKRVDLVARVRRSRETSLRSYAEAIALVMAMEMAQLELLRECCQVDAHRARRVRGREA